MNQKSIEINPNDILEEHGLFAYHEYLVTGKIMEAKDYESKSIEKINNI